MSYFTEKNKLSCQIRLSQKIRYEMGAFFFFLLSFSLFLISCSGLPGSTEKNKPARVLVDEASQPNFKDSDRSDREEAERKISSRSSCRQSNIRSRVISLSGDLDYIDSNNVGNYKLRGRCEERRRAVTIKINGYRISENPSCSRGRFEVELDLSAVASTEKNILLEISHNRESICREIRVGFLGPKNYIPVPYNEDHYEFSFYVMKYEAKLEGKGNPSAKAVSKAEENPITRVSYGDAIKLCRNNGPRYDLINNSQWQNIALSIEETDINWSRGRRSIADDNALNCGVSLGRAKPASSDDRNDCADSSCKSQWDYKRRTHVLRNGEIIWDLCGNVGEIMKDEYTLNQDFKGYIFDLSGRLKNLFGPKRTYRTGTDRNRRRHDNYFWGLGEADIEADHNLIVRGSDGRSGSGVFSVSIKQDQDDRRVLNQLGFRCVYIP